MANNDTLSYEDLIHPDNSIEKLIDMLKIVSKELNTIHLNALKTNASNADQQEAIIEVSKAYKAFSDELKHIQLIYKNLKKADSDVSIDLKELANLTNRFNAALNKCEIALEKYKGNSKKTLGALTDQKKALTKLVDELRAFANEQAKNIVETQKQAKAQRELERAIRDEEKALNHYERSVEAVSPRLAKLRKEIDYCKAALNRMTIEGKESTDEFAQMQARLKETENRYIALKGVMDTHIETTTKATASQRGLAFSVSQVVRELPNATMGFRMFMLAISNNLPIVVDEIARFREEQKILASQGEETKSTLMGIAEGFFNIQTAVVLLTTVILAYADDIGDFFNHIFEGPRTLDMKAWDMIMKNIGDATTQVKENLVNFMMLKREYNRTEDKSAFIELFKQQLWELGFNIQSVNDAEKIFADGTTTYQVEQAFVKRAQMAAAYAAATKKIEESLELLIESEKDTSGSFWTGIKSAFAYFDPENKGLTFAQIRRNYSYKRQQEYKAEFNQAVNEAEYMINITSRLQSELVKLPLIGVEGANGGKGLINAGFDYDPKGVLGIQKDAKALKEAVNTLTDTAKKKDKLELVSDMLKKLDDFTQDIANEQSPVKAAALVKQAHELKIQIEKLLQGGKGGGSNESSLVDKWLKQLEWFKKQVIKIHKSLYDALARMQTDQFTKQALTLDAQEKSMIEKYNRDYEQMVNFYAKWGHRMTEEQVMQYYDALKDISDNLAYELIRINHLRDINDKKREIADHKAFQNLPPQGKINIWASIDEEEKLQKELLTLETEYAVRANKLAGDKARDEHAIWSEHYQKMKELTAKYEQDRLAIEERATKARLEKVRSGSEEELQYKLRLIEIERQKVLAANYAKPKSEQENVADINFRFNRQSTQTAQEFRLQGLELYAQKLKAVEAINRNSTMNSIKSLEMESMILQKKIEQAAADGQINYELIERLQYEKELVDLQLEKAKNPMYQWGKQGFGGMFMDELGWSDDKKAAYHNFYQQTIGYVKELISAEVELANTEVRTAQERVSAVEKAYEQEIEARNAGYANNVDKAKLELENEKRNLKQKQKLAEEAKKKQFAVETLMQVSSLTTGAAKIFSEFPIYAAIPLVALMFSTFAAAKIQAYKAARASSDTYGEGGLEILEGGSHASGNDIDLHTKNHRGRNMRAEGGEALIILNKRATKKYKGMLPDLVDSLNKRTYMANVANETANVVRVGGDQMVQILALDALSKDVSALRSALETKQYVNGDTTVIVRGNYKRIIHNS